MAQRLADDPFKRKCQPAVAKKPLVLSKDAFNRILSHTRYLDEEEEEKLELEERKKQREAARKEFSEAFSSSRRAGSDALKKKYAKDLECARRELENEAIMEIRKNYVLNKAYKHLYKETDRVKYFNSARNFCEMMHKREDQVNVKAERRQVVAKHDALYNLGILRDVDNYKSEEKEREKIREENKKKNANNWIKQHDEKLQKKDQESWEGIRTRFHIEDEIEQEKLKEIQKEEQREQANQNYKNSLDNQTKEKLQLLEMRQQLNDAEDQRIKLFNKAKQEMDAEHEKARLDLLKRKNDRRKKVADDVIDVVSALKLKEDFSLQEAVRKTEDKARDEAAKKALEEAEALEAIAHFHAEDKKLKHRNKYEDKLKNYQDYRKMLDFADRLQEAEDSKQQKRQQLESDTQHIQLHQIAARKAADKSHEEENLKQYLYHMRGLDEEEKMFQKYAQREIEDCEARGVDTLAMRKASQPGIECGKGPLFKDRGYIRPRYYSSTLSANDLGHITRAVNQLDTKSRLGFML